MDPDTNLNEQLNLAKEILGEGTTHGIIIDAQRMAELVLALDNWLCQGGHYPNRWRLGQAAAEVTAKPTVGELRVSGTGSVYRLVAADGRQVTVRRVKDARDSEPWDRNIDYVWRLEDWDKLSLPGDDSASL